MSEEFVKALPCPACHNRPPFRDECARCEGVGWLRVTAAAEDIIREACDKTRLAQKGRKTA